MLWVAVGIIQSALELRTLYIIRQFKVSKAKEVSGPKIREAFYNCEKLPATINLSREDQQKTSLKPKQTIFCLDVPHLFPRVVGETSQVYTLGSDIMWTRVLMLLLIALSQTNTSRNNGGDLSLWIDEQQVKMFSGFSMEIYAIVDGNVLPYILDPNFETYLPIIPSEVGYVNFTWKSGVKKYYYNFDRLQSFNEDILEPPIISIKTKGRVPRRPKVFSVLLPCSGNSSGIAAFGIGLLIESRKGKPLPGTPLRLRLRKECAQRGPDPECDKKCANRGWCNHEKICQCQEGYMGQYCRTALCYPQCMNNGNCTAPGVCSCPEGYQGRHCEGGICAEKCQNGGKCVQKDSCECPKGYYGLRCEFSKCSIACLNGGRCRGVNKCRCPQGFRGDHCEIGRRVVPQRSACTRPCGHGTCSAENTCICDPGWYGRLCHQKLPHQKVKPGILTPSPLESSLEMFSDKGNTRLFL